MKKLVIVDGNNIIHRGYHRFKGMDLHNSKGFPTTAIYGYRNIIRRMFREHGTEYFVVCFDHPDPTHRHILYPEYKAGRDKKHTLREQYYYIHKITKLMGIQSFIAPGYEADDIIHTLVKKFKLEFDKILIESTDKDLHQLIESNVSQIIGDGSVMTPCKVQEKFGVQPSAMRMYISLIGDSPGSGDNIPGCKGVGKKSAQEIAKHLNTIEELMMGLRIFEIGKLQNKIKNDIDNVKLSYKLVGLVDVPTVSNARLNDLHLLGRSNKELNEIYQELEFTT